MVIFHGYVGLPEGNRLQNIDLDGKFRGRLAQDLWDLFQVYFRNAQILVNYSTTP